MDDTLSGKGGRDVLIGGLGADLLRGGGGADRFVFETLGDSAGGASDRIADLQGADVIDLSGIDADVTTAGDQTFVLTGDFSGEAGQAVLVYRAGSDRTLLRLDVDGDGRPDGVIQLAGDQTGFGEFVL